MNNKKIIISSKVLANYFKQCLNNAHPDNVDGDNDIIISVSKDTLIIENLSKRGIHVEVLNPYFKVVIHYKKLKRMVKILQALEEQPLVINFETFLITIQTILI